jgi:mono/diheme cytochrome c family protein
MMRRAAGVVTVSLSVLAIAAGGATVSPWDNVPAKQHERSNPVAGQPDAIEAGGELYREHCQQCHKADGRGDDRHPSLHSPHVRNAADGDLEWYLRQGDRAHGMPSWAALTQRERWQVVAYVKSLE